MEELNEERREGCRVESSMKFHEMNQELYKELNEECRAEYKVENSMRFSKL